MFVKYLKNIETFKTKKACDTVFNICRMEDDELDLFFLTKRESVNENSKRIFLII